MSIPITYCLFRQALYNDEAFKELVHRLQVNLKHGSMTLWACRHDPVCDLYSDEELKLLEDKLREHFQDVKLVADCHVQVMKLQ